VEAVGFAPTEGPVAVEVAGGGVLGRGKAEEEVPLGKIKTEIAVSPQQPEVAVAKEREAQEEQAALGESPAEEPFEESITTPGRDFEHGETARPSVVVPSGEDGQDKGATGLCVNVFQSVALFDGKLVMG
jgi:hypothetical protein